MNLWGARSCQSLGSLTSYFQKPVKLKWFWKACSTSLALASGKWMVFITCFVPNDASCVAFTSSVGQQLPILRPSPASGEELLFVPVVMCSGEEMLLAGKQTWAACFSKLFRSVGEKLLLTWWIAHSLCNCLKDKCCTHCWREALVRRRLWACAGEEKASGNLLLGKRMMAVTSAMTLFS